MKYLLTNLQIMQTNSTNPQRYVRAELLNEDDIFDNPSTLPTTCLFGETIVKVYETALQAAGGDANKLPDNMKYFKGAEYVDVPLPTPMYRIYGSDFVDAKGIMHKAGEYIKDKNGAPRLYTKVRVLCKKSVDNETGELRYARNWDPEKRANDYIAAFFVTPTVGGTSVEEAQQAPVEVQQAAVAQPAVIGQQAAVAQAPVTAQQAPVNPQQQTQQIQQQAPINQQNNPF